jgi:hypothetical protein
MAGSFQSFTQSTIGKVVIVVVAVAAVVVCAIVIKGSVQSETPDTAFSAMYIDTENGKSFTHKIVEGESPPVLSPFSGRNTGVQAEACYWTADGKTKDEPTWVLLNESVGKPGPTFCPDCGRLVVGHNPPPMAGGKPPPTKAEYEARRGTAPLQAQQPAGRGTGR